MALTNLFNGDELYGHMSDEMHRFYEGVLKERREHNRRGHMPAQAANVNAPPEPMEAPAQDPPRKPRARKQSAPVERREELRDMSYRLTGKRKREA